MASKQATTQASRKTVTKTRGTKAPTGGRKPKRAATQHFSDEEDIEEFEAGEGDLLEGDDSGDAALQQMLLAYKNQTTKTSNNGKAIQAKASHIFNDTRARVVALKTEFDTSIQDARDNMSELREREHQLSLAEIASLFGQRNKTHLKALLDIYQDVLPEVSRRSAFEIDSFNGDVKKLSSNRSKVFRRSVADAQDIINRALEEQKLATDSAALIKNYLEIVKT